MDREHHLHIEKVYSLLAKGEADIQQGKTISYTSSLLHDISEMGRKNSIENLPVKDEIKY